MQKRLDMFLAGFLIIFAVIGSVCQPSFAYPLTEINPPQHSLESPWLVANYVEDGELFFFNLFDIDFEPDGTLWLASASGLIRYDGYSWQTFTHNEGIPGRMVRCVLVDSQGTVWAGTDRGVVVFNGENFEPPEPAPQLACPSVRRIVEDSQGNLWFCGDPWPQEGMPGGLTLFQDGQSSIFTPEDGLPSDAVLDFFEDSNERKWALTSEGPAVFDDGSWTNPLDSSGLSIDDPIVWSIAETREGEILIAGNGILYELQAGQWSVHDIPQDWDNPSLRLCTTRAGRVYTLKNFNPNERSFFEWQEDRFVPASTKFSSMPGGIEEIEESPDGSVVAAAYNGLFRWNRFASEWKEYPGLPTPSFTDEQGRVWFDGDETWVKQGDQWFSPSGFNGDIYPDYNGGAWGVSDDEIVHWSGDGANVFSAEDVGFSRIFAAAPSRTGALCILGGLPDGRRGVVWHDGQSSATVNGVDWSGYDVRTMKTGPNGGVWLMADSIMLQRLDILRVSDSAIDVMTGDQYLLPLETLDFEVDPNGAVWAYGTQGILYHEPFSEPNQNWTQIIGLPGREVTALLARGADIWFGLREQPNRPGGIAKLHENRGGWTLHPGGTPVFGQYGLNEALAFGAENHLYLIPFEWEGEPFEIALPAPQTPRNAVFEADGGFWTGTDASVLRYSPDQMPVGVRIEPAKGVWRGGDVVELKVSGIERFKPRNQSWSYLYSWRIDQGVWSDFQPLPASSIRLAGLNPGSHEIDIRVRETVFDSYTQSVSYPFYIQPRSFVQTGWFRSAAALAAFMISALGAYALWARRELARHARDLEEIVDARTKALLESEKNYSHLFENISDAILVIDAETLIITDANSTAVDMFGYPDNELRSMQLLDLSNDPDLTRSTLNELLKKERLTVPLRYYKRKNGELFPVEVSLGKLLIEGRVCFTAVYRDISERKRNEETIRFHSSILEQLSEWVVAVDADDRILYASPSLKDALGVDPADLIGELREQALPSREAQDMLSSQGPEGAWQQARIYQSPTGEDIIVSEQSRDIFDQDGKPAGKVYVARDVTEIKRMGDELHQNRKLEAIGMLAGGVAHDFNNLLTGILGNISLVKDEFQGESVKNLSAAENAALRAADLVKQLLVFSRKADIEAKTISVNDLMSEAFAICQRAIDRKIEFEWSACPGDPRVMGDKSMLVSVIMNLCINARDAIEESLKRDDDQRPERERLFISLSARPEAKPASIEGPDGPWVAITVADNGVGIEPDKQERIFDPFYTTKAVGKGTGLGLSSAYGIIQQHRGLIELDSKPGEGASFIIHLPCSTEAAKDETTRQHSSHRGDETVLFVDDEEFIVNLAENALKQDGYSVLAALDGAQAIELFEAEQDRIDLVVLDLSMPNQSGWDVLDKIRGIRTDVPVIISSGYDLSVESSKNHERVYYLPKPYMPHKLKQTVRDVLNNDISALPKRT